ncbi:C-type lectin 37Da-like [Drosophila subpulchrella]|uniref:C-type lectin 37Da-like n=1 Tax=Drosophila subpulchrella TaxID=1486046 RepID=UPI0018A147A9|nr:C-type lectin 37Da-like [Drosophila subpulchrella]
MLTKAVAVFLLVASVDLGVSYDKYTTKILNGNPNNVNVNSSPFIKINVGFYYFGQERVNWHVADENCRKLGSDLVSFETAQEYDAIAEYLKSKGERAEHWTSGNDLGTKGAHKWYPSATGIYINRWAPNQPDNAGGIEHCIHIGYVYHYSTNIEMNDRPCREDKNSLFKYVCEAPKPETISIVVWK